MDAVEPHCPSENKLSLKTDVSNFHEDNFIKQYIKINILDVFVVVVTQQTII